MVSLVVYGIIHQRKKTTVLSCHRCLINTGVEKNEHYLNANNNFDYQMYVRVNVGIQTTAYIFKAHCSIEMDFCKLICLEQSIPRNL
jgi:hypothetical protein